MSYRRYLFKVHLSKRHREAILPQCRMAAQLSNALIELCENTYHCRREAANLSPASKFRYGGTIRRSEPKWHEPKRRWPQERKDKLRETMRRKQEEKRAKRKARPPKPRKAVAVQPLTYRDLTGEITALRWACPEWAEMGTGVQHRIADSVIKSYAAFLRGDSGRPKFKRTRDANRLPLGAGGWTFKPRGRERSRDGGNRVSARDWKLTIHGVPGWMRATGEFPAEIIKATTADLYFHGGSWWLSVCVEIERERSHGNERVTISFDLIDEFALVEGAAGPRLTCPGGSVRAEAESPHRFHNLDGGSDQPANAEADERTRSIPNHTNAAGSDQPANAEADERNDGIGRWEVAEFPDQPANAEADERRDERVVLRRRGWSADQPANAEADERNLERGRQRIRAVADQPANAEADERNAASYARAQAWRATDQPANAEADERGRRVGARWRGRESTDQPANAEADERVGDAVVSRPKRSDQVKSDRDLRYRRGSRRWRRASRRIAKLEARTARRRRENHHLWSAGLVSRANDLTITIPSIPEWIRTPRGTVRSWGTNVAFVSQLNRYVLGQAPMLAVQMLQYKAEEAGIRCDVMEDKTPAIAVGRDAVAFGKEVRRAKSAVKKRKKASGS